MQALGISLDTATLVGYWRRFDPELADLVGVMDRAEAWTLDDHPEVAQRLVRLGQRLDGVAQARALAGADRRDALLFLAYISTSRAIRVIQWMDEQGGYGSALVERLLQATSDVDAMVPEAALRQLLARRLHVFNNTPYFCKLFATARLKSLANAIHSYRQEIQDGV